MKLPYVMKLSRRWCGRQRKPAHPAHPGYTGVSDARWRNERDGNEQYDNDKDDYDTDDHDSDKLIRTIRKRNHRQAASSTPPMRWATRRAVYFYSADSPGAITRSDEMGLTWSWLFSYRTFQKNKKIKLAQGPGFSLVWRTVFGVCWAIALYLVRF